MAEAAPDWSAMRSVTCTRCGGGVRDRGKESGANAGRIKGVETIEQEAEGNKWREVSRDKGREELVDTLVSALISCIRYSKSIAIASVTYCLADCCSSK